jgi:ankyrin repeat protein
MIAAALKADARAVDSEIVLGANVNASGRNGVTPLLFVMAKRNIKAFSILLEHGADPNYQVNESAEDINQGSSIMNLSAMADDSEFLREAVRHRGDANLVNIRRGDTPIFDAIEEGREENIRILIRAGADLNYQAGRIGMATPLLWAASSSRYDFVYILLVAGADHRIQNNAGRDLARIIKEDLARGSLSSAQKEWAKKASEYIRQH